MIAYYKIVVPGGDRGDEAPRQKPIPPESRVATWLAFSREEARRLASRFCKHDVIAVDEDGDSWTVWL